MPTSIELRQEAARVVDAARAILEPAEAENRDLDATEKVAYNKAEADYTALKERAARQETVERADAEGARSINNGGLPGGGAPAGGGQGDQPAQRRAAFYAFIRRGQSGLTPETRALVENPAGEILVPEDLETEIIRALPALTVIRGISSQRSVTSNRVRRRSLNEVAVGWGALETAEQVLTDSMPPTPTQEYTYIEDLYGLAKIGEDELDDSDTNLEAIVKDSFGRAIAEAEDTAFAIGVGHTVNQPVGIFSVDGGVPSVTSTATNYSSGTTTNAPGLLVDDLKGLIYALPPQYRGNGSFLMSSLTELAVSSRKDGQGRYLWEPNTQAGRPSSFLGYAIHNQENLDTIDVGKAIAAFGDFNVGYKVYDRAGMTFQRLVELYAEEGMVGFKVRFRVGGDVVRPNAIRILKTAAA